MLGQWLQPARSALHCNRLHGAALEKQAVPLGLERAARSDLGDSLRITKLRQALTHLPVQGTRA